MWPQQTPESGRNYTGRNSIYKKSFRCCAGQLRVPRLLKWVLKRLICVPESCGTVRNGVERCNRRREPRFLHKFVIGRIFSAREDSLNILVNSKSEILRVGEA